MVVSQACLPIRVFCVLPKGGVKAKPRVVHAPFLPQPSRASADEHEAVVALFSSNSSLQSEGPVFAKLAYLGRI